MRLMADLRGSLLFPAILALAVLAGPAFAENLKLYTTDGEYQVVREYQVVGDRVRFYSVDRSDWDEVPAVMVDLKKTESEAAARKAVSDKQTKEFDEEATAAAAERAELAMIPKDSGVYQIIDGKLRTFPVADFTVHTPKGNTILRVLTPIPVIEGRATVEVKGDHSPNVVADRRPEFFFQLDNEESFGIIKMRPGKGLRIAESVEIVPVSKEYIESRDSVQIFSKQLPGDDFYKVWPQEPLEPGEYALIEYQETKVELRLWDFRIE